jgi:acyl dehydratase
MSARSIGINSVAQGDQLPALDIDLTTSLIVGGAIASRDFTPVHHDKAAAQATGMQDVFMNILSTNGLVGRFVTDWTGADASIKNVAIKLGTPNLPGDTMKLSGVVKSVDGASRLVEVDVVGKNAWGNHVEGTVTVELPAGE